MTNDANLQIESNETEQDEEKSDNKESQETKELKRKINKIKSVVGVIISLVVQFLYRHGLVRKIDYRELSLDIHNMLEEKRMSLVIENESNKTVNFIIAFDDNNSYIHKLIIQSSNLNALFVGCKEEIQLIRCNAEKTVAPNRFDYERDPLIIMNYNTFDEVEFTFDKLF